MKIIGYIFAAILVVFGALMVIGATDPVKGTLGWIPVGAFLILIGLVIIYFSSRSKPAAQQDGKVTVNVELPGNVKMDALKCQSCGGELKPGDISMVAGAPVVTCPYCHTTYQLTEEPKW